MAEPVSKAQIDPNFQRRLVELAAQAAAEFAAGTTGGRTEWYRPVGYNGDMANWEGFDGPFSASAAEQYYQEAVADAAAPGTTGDIVATTTMIDDLQCQARAYAVRLFLRGPRAYAHMLARKNGHGNDVGAILQNRLNYVLGLLAQAAVPLTSTEGD